MLKKNPILFYLAIILLVIGVVKNYTKESPENKTEYKKPDKVIEINSENLGKSIDDMSRYLKNKKQPIEEEKIKGKVSYFKNPNFADKVNLCNNNYTAKVVIFNEKGTRVYVKDNFQTNELKNSEAFYNFVQNTLVLTSPNERVEIFFLDGQALPKIFTDKITNLKQAFILKFIDITSNDRNYIFRQNVTLTQKPVEVDNFARKSIHFKCGQKLKLNYTIKDEENQIISTETKTIVLGDHRSDFDKILEYIILNSNNNSLEAFFKSYAFNHTIQDQQLQIIGEIKILNDER